LARGRDCDDIDVNPLTAHLISWFNELSDSRRFTVVAGMSGGACIPEAISHQEMAAWSQITGNELTPWEGEALKEMDRSWRRAYGDKKGGTATSSGMQHQGLGEYCRGVDVEECRKQFGTQLETLCATCPN